MRAPLAFLAALALATLAPRAGRGEDEPTPPATPESSTRREGGSPVETGWQSLKLTTGSKPDEIAEASVSLFLASWKKRSHFGFDEHAGRSGEVAFGKNLGTPSLVEIPGLSLQVNLRDFGWLAGEVAGFSLSDLHGTVDFQRTTNGIVLSQGDELHSHLSFLFARLLYGFDLRFRMLLDRDVPIELAVSPYYGFWLADIDVRTRRVSPNPTAEVGGHDTALWLSPGLRIEVDLLDHVGVGLDYGLPGAIALDEPQVRASDRIRAYGKVYFENVSAAVGFRLLAFHLDGGGSGLDTRFYGIDFSLGFAF